MRFVASFVMQVLMAAIAWVTLLWTHSIDHRVPALGFGTLLPLVIGADIIFFLLLRNNQEAMK